MKSTKGFTLLELLAVIVVLAIIALIVTPFVTEAIVNAREGADRNAGFGIVNAAELYYATVLGDPNSTHAGSFETTVINFEPDTGNSIAPDSGETSVFEFKGKAPIGGQLTIDSEGNIVFAVPLIFSSSDDAGFYYNGKDVTRDIEKS